MSDSELFSMFITLGPISSHRIARDHRTNYSYGYGFVEYEGAADAVKALQQLNGLQIQNKRLKVAGSYFCLSRPHLTHQAYFIKGD